MVHHRAPRALAAVGVVLGLVPALAGCSGGGAAVQRIVVCVGTDDQHPAGTPVQITVEQSGEDVASASTRTGVLVALLVPELPTAVLVDGRELGETGWDGNGPDPRTDTGDAPSEDAVRAAAATDPGDVVGYAGITGPGCPPAARYADG